MSEEIDKAVFRKYEVQGKLGKGVRLSDIKASIERCAKQPQANFCCSRAGLRYCLEGNRQENAGGAGAQENI